MWSITPKVFANWGPGLGFDNPGYRVEVSCYRNPEGVARRRNLTRDLATRSGLRQNEQRPVILCLPKLNLFCRTARVLASFLIDSLASLKRAREAACSGKRG